MAVPLCLIALSALAIARGNDTANQQKLNGGYYLLNKLAGDESQLPLLLDIKHAPQEVVTFADRVSRTGKATSALLDKFHERDHAIQFDRNPLPEIEQDVRDSIKGDKQHQLLFGTKDDEFVRALCVSQIEAGNYGIHLCKVLGDQETSPSRAEQLHRLETKWLAIREESSRILRNY